MIPVKEGDLVKGGWGILNDLIRPYKLQVVVLSFVSLVSALLEAGFIVLLTSIAMSLVDGHAAVGPVLGQTFSRETALVIATVALITRVISSLLGVRIAASLTADITIAQRRALSHAYLRSSWDVQHAEPSGRLQELLTTFVTKITKAVAALTTSMTAGLSLGAFLVSGFIMDPLSTGAVLVALGAVSLILIPIRRAIRRRSRSEALAGVVFANSVAEVGSLGLEMQTFGAEDRFESLVDELTLAAGHTQRSTAVVSGAVPHIYISLAYGVVLAGLALLAGIQVADFAVLGAILLLMLRSISYGQQLSTASATLVAVFPFLEQLEEVKTLYAASKPHRGRQIPPSSAPLVAHNVDFGYRRDRPALTDVNFRLEEGEVLGIIGPSGAGKSTLAQLLLGLREPTDGDLKVAGVDINEIDRHWWTERVAFVPQEAQLFTGTVAENIRFFREGISEVALRDAAARANVLRDIEALPDGFNSHLGQRGSQLSGGQKQRLSIARALVGNPGLLVLDEPTSALDGQSEVLIRDTLAQLKGEITIVIIAHRISTLDICDRIMVIEGGRITALGTPETLHAKSQFYRQALVVAGIT